MKRLGKSDCLSSLSGVQALRPPETAALKGYLTAGRAGPRATGGCVSRPAGCTGVFSIIGFALATASLVLEVSRIPPATLQLEASGSDHLGQFRLSTLRAVLER